MPDLLFLVEIIIKKFKFTRRIETTPRKNYIYTLCRFGSYSMNINNNNFPDPDFEDAREFDYNIGKSIVFPCRPGKITAILKHSPLEFEVYDQYAYLGAATLEWYPEFLAPIREVRKSLQPTPVEIRETINLIAGYNKNTGSMDIFLRLSCLGFSLENLFSIKDENDECLIRKSKSNIISCKKVLSSEVPFIEPGRFAKSSLEIIKQPKAEEKVLSWFEVFKTPLNRRVSTILQEFLTPLRVDSQCSMLTIAMKDTQEIKTVRLKDIIREIRILDVIHAEVQLTAEELNKVICKNPSCPGAKRFGNVGIGPLATKKLEVPQWNPLDHSITQRFSHLGQHLDLYGPDSKYRKPKHIDLKFSPKREPCHCPPLRLIGGGPNGLDEDTETYKTIITFKSPILECEDIFNNLDSILNEFRQAQNKCRNKNSKTKLKLGTPSSCMLLKNLAYVMERENSKQFLEDFSCTDLNCPFSLMHYDEDENVYDNIDNCVDVDCPLADQKDMALTKKLKNGKLKPACGLTNCPYAKYRASQEDEDYRTEMEFFSSPTIGNCGHKNCDYASECFYMPEIHWDCLNPLPKGICRDPTCKIKPRQELKYTIKGPCGNEICPFAIPLPCKQVNCPFRVRPCPYRIKKEDKKGCTIDKCTLCYTDDERKNRGKVCEKLTCMI